MKTKSAFLLFFLPVFAQAQSKGFTIQGNLPESAGTANHVYLRYTTGDETVHDSTDIKDDKFSFTGHVNDTDVHSAYLSYGNSLRSSAQSQQTVLYVKNGDQIVLISIKMFGDSILGSPQTSAYRNMVKQINKRTPKDEIVAIYTHLIEEYPDSKMSLELLVRRFNDAAIGLNYVSQLSLIIEAYNKLSPRIKETEEGKKYRDQLQRRLQISPGGTLPNFESRTPEGKIVKLSDLRGKYVLVDFWASWCIPCRAEFPYLKKAYARFKNKNFEIVGYSIDNKKSLWASALQNDDIPWINLSDLVGPKDPIALMYNIVSIPSNFLIGPDGKVLATNLRGDAVEPMLAKYIHE